MRCQRPPSVISLSTQIYQQHCTAHAVEAPRPSRIYPQPLTVMPKWAVSVSPVNYRLWSAVLSRLGHCRPPRTAPFGRRSPDELRSPVGRRRSFRSRPKLLSLSLSLPLSLSLSLSLSLDRVYQETGQTSRTGQSRIEKARHIQSIQSNF